MTPAVAAPNWAPGDCLWSAYLAWRAIATPFSDFVFPAPFLASDPPLSSRPARADRAGVVAAIGSFLDAGQPCATAAHPGRRLLVLDLPPLLSVSAAPGLARSGCAVIPIFERWPHPVAVLPCVPLQRALIAAAGVTARSEAGAVRTRQEPLAGNAGVRRRWRTTTGRPPPGDRTAVALLLDGGRDRAVSGCTLRRRFDNRYEYTRASLPRADQLREWGVVEALWIARTALIAADLQEYAESLLAAGISIRTRKLAARERSPSRPHVLRQAGRSYCTAPGL